MSRRWLFVLLVMSVVFAGFIWAVRKKTPADAQELLRQANAHFATQRFNTAEAEALQAFDIDANLTDALLLAARCARASGDAARAIEHVTRIPDDHPRLRLSGLLLAAECQRSELFHLSEAEKSYRKALQIEPENLEALHGLVTLLGLCARRQEAIPFILQLVRNGHAEDLLIMLARRQVIIADEELLERARQAAPEDPNPLLGQAWQIADRGDHEQAIELLEQAAGSGQPLPAVHVALGEQLQASHQFEKLLKWSAQLPEAADDFPQTWIVRGRMALAVDDLPGAARCFLESSRLAPELKAPHVELARLLNQLGLADKAEVFAQRASEIDELDQFQSRFTYEPDYLLEMIGRFQSIGRLWEAYGWCQLLARSAPSRDVEEQLRELTRLTSDLPLTQTVDAKNIALAIDRDQFPLPTFDGFGLTKIPQSDALSQNVSFREEAKDRGLVFRYHNGADVPRHRMFEFTGGGIGVIDFDVDGHPDVFFSQGHNWPQDSVRSTDNDALFQNQEGQRFVNVSLTAGIRESSFGQGVTVGDVDSDGFSDLYVANIGENQLWLNNGDGTFTNATAASLLRGDVWTTSCLLADLSGDGLPDIYDVNYETGDDIFDRVCFDQCGRPRLCLPTDFEGAVDQVWINRGDGTFENITESGLSTPPDGKGLGIVAWDAEGTGRLNVFVANDTTPNFYFVNESVDNKVFLRESGIYSGLALNRDGKSEGSMGIALADVNQDGALDVHVTNFYHESNTLYMNQAPGFFGDETSIRQLDRESWDDLGFGTQFLDANLDSQLDLFVTNGHVDDLTDLGKPNRMFPQFFQWTGQKFNVTPDSQLGPYFEQRWLGRSAAKIDWNRDGLEDLLVGHLYDESALLTNTSDQTGHFLALKLLGNTSNRDAIGTTVEVHFDDQIRVLQLAADGGYQASNQRQILVGLGVASHVSELVVRWPSGLEQRFADVSVSREYLLREGGSLLNRPTSTR